MSAQPRARRGADCPSELALHQLATGELEGGVAEELIASHARGCVRCGALLDELASLVVPAPDPAFWAAVVGQAPPRPARRRFLGPGLAVTGVALGAALFVLAPRPRVGSSDVRTEGRTKGSVALGLVVRRASGQIEHLSSGGVVATGDTLRFQLAQAESGFVVVLGLDARPSVSVYAPQDGGGARATPAGETLLPEAVVTDETPGVERVVVLSCATAPAPADVRAAATRALAAAGGAPDKVGALGLPCRQSSVLITKAPAR